MKKIIYTFFIIMAHCGFVYSADLSLMPISLDIKAPKVQDNFTVRNDGDTVVKMQVRIFKWEQKNGKNYYTPTHDVVVSPPFPTIKPNTDTIVRVIRVSKKPVVGEEAYRVFFDELPTRKIAPNRVGVNVLTRQVVPVFFSSSARSKDQTTWSVREMASGFEIIGSNTATDRLRVSDVILLQGKTVVGSKSGLVGYVLGKSSSVLEVPRTGKGTPDKIRLLGDFGAMEADVKIVK